MEGDEAAPRVRIGGRLLQQLDDLLEPLLEQRFDQLLSVGEVPVNGADADAGVVRDFVQGHPETVRGEQLPCPREDPLPVALGVLSQLSLGRRHKARVARKRIASIHF